MKKHFYITWIFMLFIILVTIHLIFKINNTNDNSIVIKSFESEIELIKSDISEIKDKPTVTNGENGKDGKDGSVGKDGVNGTNGLNGSNGSGGTSGDSAYQTWLKQGNTGTEKDFIDSLKGKDAEVISPREMELRCNLSKNRVEWRYTDDLSWQVLYEIDGVCL